MRKAQSALEYLTIFSFAIIIIIIVGGALFYLGVFNPDQNTVTVVYELSNFHVDDAILESNGDLSLDLGVKTGQTTEVSNIDYSIEEYNCFNSLDESDFSVTPENTILLTLSPDSGCNLEPGSMVTMNVNISYVRSSGIEHKDFGRIRILVQSNQTNSNVSNGGNFAWFTGNESTFGEGTYVNTTWGSIILSGNNITGTYTSKVFDAEATASWNNLTWNEDLPYGEELPLNFNMSENVLLFNLNELSGIIQDESGQGNNGINNGSLYGQEGKFDYAMWFDGSNDIITSVSSNQITGDNIQTITLSAWVKHNYTGDNGYILSLKRSASLSTLISLDAGNTGPGNLGFLTRNFADTTHSWLNYDGGYNDNKWHHLVGVVDGLNRYLYVDGILRNSDSQGMQNVTGNTANFSVGGFDSTYSSLFFEGDIDEVAIWRRALSSDEILDLYKRGALRLNVTVRSCDDSVCSGESWSSEYENNIILSEIDNQYFQYKFNFYTDNSSYSPVLNNVTVNYEIN